MMDLRKIAIIYDTSYLAGGFPSIKQFILSRRFAGAPKPSVLEKVLSKVSKKPPKTSPASGEMQEAGSLFAVSEVIPTEVVNDIDQNHGADSKVQQTVAALLKDGAARIDLALDSVVGQSPAGGRLGALAAGGQGRREGGENLVRYAVRLVSYGTKERYDLAVVATQDEHLLKTLADIAGRGQAVFGLKGEQLTGTRVFHDKVAQVANLGRTAPLVLVES